MFIGHFAVGLASKRIAPTASLGALLAAPLLLDLLWPVCLLLGIESVTIEPGNTVVTPLDLHDYPYTHSLAMALVWSVLLAAGYFAFRRSARNAWVLALGVFSHWILDFVAHRPDLPLYPGSMTYVGLGLWGSLPATLAVELTIFAAGVWIYMTTTTRRNRTGAIALWAMLALVVVLYFMSVLGPPPPSSTAIATAGLATWLFVAWGWWIDRNRQPAVP